MSEASQVRASWTFAQIPDDVLYADIPDKAIRLFAALHKYSTLPHGAIPSRQRIAEQLHCTDATIDRAVIDLVGAGFLAITHRWRLGDAIYEGAKGPPGAMQTSNLYELMPQGVTQKRVERLLKNEQGGYSETSTNSEGSEREGSEEPTLARTREKKHGPDLTEAQAETLATARALVAEAFKGRKGSASQRNRLERQVRLGATLEMLRAAIVISREAPRDDALAFTLGCVGRMLEDAGPDATATGGRRDGSLRGRSAGTRARDHAEGARGNGSGGRGPGRIPRRQSERPGDYKPEGRPDGEPARPTAALPA